jgi:hypothetical protein
MILQMIALRVMTGAQLLLVLMKDVLVFPQVVFVVWTIPRMMGVDLVVGKHLLLVRQAIFVVWTILPMMVLVLALVLWFVLASVRHGVLGLPGGMRFVIGLLKNRAFSSQAKWIRVFARQ